MPCAARIKTLSSSFGGCAGATRIRAYGVTPSLAPLLRECASIVTKPGISTLLESHAARRKIFLLKGMPVAEDNNARFAIEHFGAEQFEVKAFARWHARRVESHPHDERSLRYE